MATQSFKKVLFFVQAGMVKLPHLQNYTLQYPEKKFSHNMPDKFVNF